MLNKKGFTLIELLVVIIIVGILASVSIPMMRGNVSRAKASEAIAGVGSIRTQMRLVRAEHGAYNVGVSAGAVVNNVPGFTTGDLAGRYYSDADYSIVALGFDADNFEAKATGAASGGTSGDTMTGIDVTMDQDGALTTTGF